MSNVIIQQRVTRLKLKDVYFKKTGCVPVTIITGGDVFDFYVYMCCYARIHYNPRKGVYKILLHKNVNFSELVRCVPFQVVFTADYITQQIK